MEFSHFDKKHCKLFQSNIIIWFYNWPVMKVIYVHHGQLTQTTYHIPSPVTDEPSCSLPWLPYTDNPQPDLLLKIVETASDVASEAMRTSKAVTNDL